jgi:hypothetical protein
MSAAPPFAGSVVICGCVRNCDSELKKNLGRLSLLERSVSRLHVVIAENDSKDATRQVAERWMKGSPNHHLVDPDLRGIEKAPVGANPFFGLRRIEKMARLRNSCLERVESSGMEVDRVIWIDLDVYDFAVDDLLHALALSEDHDAVMANGVMPTDDNRAYAYYDTYATVLESEPLPLSMARMDRVRAALSKLSRHADPVPVISAFGGIGIYRADAVRGLRYKAVPNPDPDIESLVEHTTYQIELAERGYGRIVLDPRLYVRHDTRLHRALKYPEVWFRKHIRRKGR